VAAGQAQLLGPHVSWGKIEEGCIFWRGANRSRKQVAGREDRGLHQFLDQRTLNHEVTIKDRL
jgi:ABC-type branched-subunit amino acid transport system ATPase component